MSQYESRIAIKVSSPKVWEKFKEEDDASLELYSLSNTNTQFYESDCCYLEDELYGIVEAISKKLGITWDEFEFKLKQSGVPKEKIKTIRRKEV